MAAKTLDHHLYRWISVAGERAERYGFPPGLIEESLQTLKSHFDADYLMQIFEGAENLHLLGLREQELDRWLRGGANVDAHKAAFLVTKILLPIDFSPSSEAALEAATDLAQQFHARIHLVHIIPESPDFNGSDFFPETAVLQERREVIEQKLASFKERLVRHGVHASFSIEEGNDIAGNLMRVIKLEKADMVVISTHGLTGWRPFVFGSIAEQVIKQVDCPLLLLRPVRHAIAATEPANEASEHSVVPHGAETEHAVIS